jgi:hypothetical protein
VKLVQSRVEAVWESKVGALTKALLGVVVEEAKSLAAFTLGVLGQLARKEELSAITKTVSMEKCGKKGWMQVTTINENKDGIEKGREKREECHLRCLDIVSLESSLLHLLAKITSELGNTGADIYM